MKTCKLCGETKPFTEFPKNGGFKDGYLNRCKACKNAKAKAHYQANKERINAKTKAYYEANKEKVNKQKTEYYVNKRRTDPQFDMVCRLRTRLGHVLNGGLKPAKTMALLGCSREEFAAHIESQFAEGMTWENRSEWHLDHIRPIATFSDPLDPECWHYTNLRPLWEHDNCSRPKDGRDLDV